MELSIMLFRLFGFFFVIMGGIYIFRHDHIRIILQDFFKNSAIMILAAVINLVLGLLITLNYTHWELSARGFITLIGYSMVLKAIIYLYFPELAQRMAKKISTKKSFFIVGFIPVLIGLWLLYEGFLRLS